MVWISIAGVVPEKKKRRKEENNKRKEKEKKRRKKRKKKKKRRKEENQEKEKRNKRTELQHSLFSLPFLLYTQHCLGYHPCNACGEGCRYHSRCPILHTY